MSTCSKHQKSQILFEDNSSSVLVELLGILSNFSTHLPEYSPVILTIEISRKKRKVKELLMMNLIKQ